jgi:hypothetical protein
MARTKLTNPQTWNPKRLRQKLGGIDDTLDSILFLGYTGKNGAGACTCTGARVGDKVAGTVNMTDGGTASSLFESTITVANQIQQSSATDLSAKKFSVLLLTNDSADA